VGAKGQMIHSKGCVCVVEKGGGRSVEGHACVVNKVGCHPEVK